MARLALAGVALALQKTGARSSKPISARLREGGARWMCWRFRGEFDGAHKVHRTQFMMFGGRRRDVEGRRARAGVFATSFSDFSNAALDEGEEHARPDYRDA